MNRLYHQIKTVSSQTSGQCTVFSDQRPKTEERRHLRADRQRMSHNEQWMRDEGRHTRRDKGFVILVSRPSSFICLQSSVCCLWSNLG